MRNVKLAIRLLIGFVLLGLIVYFVVINWSFVFSKRVYGEIVNVERVTDPSAILSARTSEAQIHSYSILIQGEDGKLYTSSSEDSQWQVAKKGYCADVRLYRYPPWHFDRASTFFNARLLELTVCKGKSAPPAPPAGGGAEASP
ncbi:MAG TPA: hypothetical protein PKC28_12300 [Bdellovibrionales bacterium]|nr:hypothetical protein [Bdellovibrionales bacterium]